MLKAHGEVSGEFHELDRHKYKLIKLAIVLGNILIVDLT